MGDLNPHQFGDQLTLFDAPLGQPDRGTFKGNPHARLYRAVHVPNRIEGLRNSRFGWDVGGSDADAAHDVLDHANMRRSDSGHNIQMGIHWQHDLGYAQDLGDNLSTYGRHEGRGTPVIFEADHPGHEHVVDNTPEPNGGPPEGAARAAFGSKNRLTGREKDWYLIHDTVGPHNLDAAMQPEVPIRPGSPLQIRAVHFRDPEHLGNWIRVPMKRKGEA